MPFDWLAEGHVMEAKEAGAMLQPLGRIDDDTVHHVRMHSLEAPATLRCLMQAIGTVGLFVCSPANSFKRGAQSDVSSNIGQTREDL
jgi:hypothetical protein